MSDPIEREVWVQKWSLSTQHSLHLRREDIDTFASTFVMNPSGEPYLAVLEDGPALTRLLHASTHGVWENPPAPPPA
jgi:hypothetical protein